MNQDGSNADNIRGLQDSQDGVPHQRAPEALALIILIHREPAQNNHNHRHGIRRIAPYAARRCFSCHRAGCQAVVSGDSLLMEHDVGARCAVLLILQCAPS